MIRLINELLTYGLHQDLIREDDMVFHGNQLGHILGLTPEPAFLEGHRPLPEILNDLLDEAGAKGLIDPDSIGERDALDTKIMGCFTPWPSVFRQEVKRLYQKDPQRATAYFYQIMKDVNYIRTDRILKNKQWTTDSPCGPLQITINLSKPEKDPKEIAKAKDYQRGYPKCLLCKENEGYQGHPGHPARQNLRLFPVTLGGESWFLQYSPYSYYEEHAIILKGEHEPMVITEKTFQRLLDFVEVFPHYFIGSNADLPIVGGSILSHDHYQGGKAAFPMEEAASWHDFTPFAQESVQGSLLQWPLSVIRLQSKDKVALGDLANKIFLAWQTYDDESLGILHESQGMPHNTITPIARYRKGHFEIDLVLRNNRQSEAYPYGIFHPHEDLHHIKKENIGLIEVMGLAVLPARLDKELGQIKPYVVSGQALPAELYHHQAWVTMLHEGWKSGQEEDLDSYLERAVGQKFYECLLAAGVYKNTPAGQAGFVRFIKTLT